MQVRSLVRELTFPHVLLWPKKPKHTQQKQYDNKFNKDYFFKKRKKMVAPYRQWLLKRVNLGFSSLFLVFWELEHPYIHTGTEACVLSSDQESGLSSACVILVAVIYVREGQMESTPGMSQRRPSDISQRETLLVRFGPVEV